VQGWLDVDGAPVAWLLALRRHDRLFMLKTGYDERARSLAPGLVLHLLTAERCFVDGFKAYELLGDAERWKLELSTGVREHRRLWAFRRGPEGLARLVARRWVAPPARALRGRVANRLAQATTKGSSRV
jgi:CelD/BcsL family acetyltransferase involved in cellulose biosynthesis